jgi:hypothetical protein
MPMVVLAIRIEIELIFKNTYKTFFSKEQHEKVSFLRLMTPFRSPLSCSTTLLLSWLTPTSISQDSVSLSQVERQ